MEIMNIDFNKLKESSVLALACILMFISTGSLFIYIFNAELFFRLDFFKIILISISITAPIWSINAFLFKIFEIKKENYSDSLQISIFIGCLFSIPVFYIPIILKFFFNFNTKWGILILLIVQLLTTINFIYTKYKETKKIMKKSN